jgi:glutamate-ammonia-ligase adenylyltransferase
MFVATSTTVETIYTKQLFDVPDDARAVAITTMLASKAEAILELLTTAVGDGAVMHDNISDLLEHLPEATAWLDNDEDLEPRDVAALRVEIDALVARHDTHASAVTAIRAMRRREVLRLAIAGIVGVGDIAVLATGLTDLSSAVLAGFVAVALRDASVNPEFAVVAMGRFGGGELVFGSDLDVMFVYRATSACAGPDAQARAEEIVSSLLVAAEDPQLALEIDTDLRPEGKQGVRVRSLDSYAQYYARWGATWETQALLRATVVAPVRLSMPTPALVTVNMCSLKLVVTSQR